MVSIFGKSRFTLSGLIDFGGKYIYQDNHNDTKYNRICSKQMDITMRRYLIKMGSIFISLFACLVNPIHVYFEQGIKTTTTECHWPFFETKSNAEFTANLVLQTIIAVHGYALFVFFEIFLSLFENVVTVTPRLVENDLTNTIRLYKNASMTKLELCQWIRNISMQSIDFDE